MHWHLALALLLTVLACSARSECQSFAEVIRQVNNTGRGHYTAQVPYSVKFQRSSNAMKTSGKESVSAGVVFMGIRGSSISVSYGTENDVKQQVSRISNDAWAEMARQAMDKNENLVESYDVPPGSGLTVFQLHLTCDGYELSLPKLIVVLQSI